MKIIPHLILFCIFVLIQSAFAQPLPSKTLSLFECIQLAQSQGAAADVVKNQYQAAYCDYQSFRAGLYPQLFMNIDAPRLNRAINPILLDNGTTRFVTQSEAYSSLNLEVQQDIPWTGGQVSVVSAIQRIDLFGNVDSYLWRSTPMLLQLQQPLFQFNALSWNSHLEAVQYQREKQNYEEQIAALAVEVARRFFDLFVAEINYKMAKTNLAVNDTIYQISTGRYNVGRIAENDLLQSELKVMDARTQLSSTNLQYEEYKENLRLYMGLADTNFSLQPPVRIPRLAINPEFAVSQARENNSNFYDYRYRRLSASRDVAQAKSEANLSALVTASFGYNQSATEVRDLYQNPLDQQSFNLNVQIPIMNWGRGKSAVAAAKSRQESVIAQTALEEEEFESQVYYQALEVMQLQQQVKLAARADTIAARRFEVTKNRYLIGKIDITNMFIAQNEKDIARRSYIQTLRQFWTAYYTLQRLTLYDFVNERKLGK